MGINTYVLCIFTYATIYVLSIFTYTPIYTHIRKITIYAKQVSSQMHLRYISI